MSSHSYSKVDEPLMSGEDGYSEISKNKKSAYSLLKKSSLWDVAFAMLGTLLIFALGVVTGQNLPVKHETRTLLAPVGDVKFFMEYNSTFTIHPSPETEAAWASLFPKGKGFVRHETIAPETSGLVVYHGLHCLKSLHEVYYAALDGKLSHDIPKEHAHLTSPHHVRHCFDYLRQSLMCSADTNLEPVSKDLKGVTGWGFTRTCRDLDSVKAWAEANWSNDV